MMKNPVLCYLCTWCCPILVTIPSVCEAVFCRLSDPYSLVLQLVFSLLCCCKLQRQGALWASPHSCHPCPWPQTFPLFQRFVAQGLGSASSRKSFQGMRTYSYKWLPHKFLENGSIGKRKSCRKGYSNRWRQKEGQQRQCWYWWGRKRIYYTMEYGDLFKPTENVDKYNVAQLSNGKN